MFQLVVAMVSFGFSAFAAGPTYEKNTCIAIYTLNQMVPSQFEFVEKTLHEDGVKPGTNTPRVFVDAHKKTNLICKNKVCKSSDGKLNASFEMVEGAGKNGDQVGDKVPAAKLSLNGKDIYCYSQRQHLPCREIPASVSPSEFFFATALSDKGHSCVLPEAAQSGEKGKAEDTSKKGGRS